jgi:hypothetical protein
LLTIKSMTMFLLINTFCVVGAPWLQAQETNTQFEEIQAALKASFDVLELAEIRADVDKLEIWSREHADEWAKVKASEEKVEAISKLSIWEKPEDGLKFKTLYIRLQYAAAEAQKPGQNDFETVVAELEKTFKQAQATEAAVIQFSKNSRDEISKNASDVKVVMGVVGQFLN